MAFGSSGQRTDTYPQFLTDQSWLSNMALEEPGLWLSVFPRVHTDFILYVQKFYDSLFQTYTTESTYEQSHRDGWLQATCLQHSLTVNVEHLIHQRHDDVTGVITNILS